MTKSVEQKKKSLGHYGDGVAADWYKRQELSDEEREVFRLRSIASRTAKIRAMNGQGPKPIHPINKPRLRPERLMPKLKSNGLRSLSLFSGCGGLDLGFDLAGYSHAASFEIMTDAGITLGMNRPGWKVFSGEEGNVKLKDWGKYKGKVDVIHGGPPCQPFSIAGRQKGQDDDRNLFPEFVRCIEDISPRAFLAENVPSLANKKFSSFLKKFILEPLQKNYKIHMFKLSAHHFGVPQNRTRLFFVGFKHGQDMKEFCIPTPTHSSSNLNENSSSLLFDPEQTNGMYRCMGSREALGLPDIGHDALAPTIRSGLTGPRHTTSINNSTASSKKWADLEIWPNGVASSRENASKFVPNNKHFRLSVQDCCILQGFPESWRIHGAVYMVIGQIGNSVVPPVAYQIAKAIAESLR